MDSASSSGVGNAADTQMPSTTKAAEMTEMQCAAILASLNESIEASAEKHQLSTLNVKSILCHILKDPQASAMLLGVDPSSIPNLPSIKLTRSRARAAKQGEVELAPVSAALRRPLASLLEVDFSHLDDDDDDWVLESERPAKRRRVGQVVGDVENPVAESAITAEDDLAKILEEEAETSDEDGTEDDDGDDDDDEEEEEDDDDDESKVSDEEEVDEDELAELRQTAAAMIEVEDAQLRVRPTLSPSKTTEAVDQQFATHLPPPPTHSPPLVDPLIFAPMFENDDENDEDFANYLLFRNSLFLDEVAVQNGGERANLPTGGSLFEDDDADDDADWNLDLTELNVDVDREELRTAQIPMREVRGLLHDLVGPRAPKTSDEFIAGIENTTPGTVFPMMRAKVRRRSTKVPTVLEPQLALSAVLGDGTVPCILSPSELDQLRRQISQHIQQLTQQVVLCFYEPTLEAECSEAMTLLNDIDNVVATCSYSVCAGEQLDAAMETCRMIYEEGPNPKRAAVSIRRAALRRRRMVYISGLPIPIAALAPLAESRAIRWPELVPAVGAAKLPILEGGPGKTMPGKVPQRAWTDEEIMLLALASLRFSATPVPERYEAIAEFALANRSAASISSLVRNMRHNGHRMMPVLEEALKGKISEDTPKIVATLKPVAIELNAPITDWPQELWPYWMQDYDVLRRRRCLTMPKPVAKLEKSTTTTTTTPTASTSVVVDLERQQEQEAGAVALIKTRTGERRHEACITIKIAGATKRQADGEDLHVGKSSAITSVQLAHKRKDEVEVVAGVVTKKEGEREEACATIKLGAAQKQSSSRESVEDGEITDEASRPGAGEGDELIVICSRENLRTPPSVQNGAVLEEKPSETGKLPWTPGRTPPGGWNKTNDLKTPDVGLKRKHVLDSDGAGALEGKRLASATRRVTMISDPLRPPEPQGRSRRNKSPPPRVRNDDRNRCTSVEGSERRERRAPDDREYEKTKEKRSERRKEEKSRQTTATHSSDRRRNTTSGETSRHAGTDCSSRLPSSSSSIVAFSTTVKQRQEQGKSSKAATGSAKEGPSTATDDDDASTASTVEATGRKEKGELDVTANDWTPWGGPHWNLALDERLIDYYECANDDVDEAARRAATEVQEQKLSAEHAALRIRYILKIYAEYNR